MKLAYVAGHYRGKSKIKLINKLQIIRNIIRARKVAMELWKLNYATLCPHSNTALFDGITTDEVFLYGDLVMLAKCYLVVLIKDWHKSSGTIGEVNFAKAHKISIYEWDYKANKMFLMQERGEL